MEQNDHDLLIQLNTKMEMVLKMLSDNNNQVITLSGRVSALETKDSRDSEKVNTISKDVQTSLQNSNRIIALEERMDSMKDEITTLRNRGNAWDIVNSIGIGIGTLIGYVFGVR